MRSWQVAAIFAAAAFVGSILALIMAKMFPGLETSARAFVVGSGALLAAFIVAGLCEDLKARIERDRWDMRPLVSMHSRRR